MSEASEHTHPIAAQFRERRSKDRVAWMKLLIGGGFAVVAAQQMLLIIRDELRAYRMDRAATTSALVLALKEQTVAIDNLVWTMWEDRANDEQRQNAIMRRLGVPIPVKVVRPPPPAPVKAVEEVRPGEGG